MLERTAAVRAAGRISLLGDHEVAFDNADLIFHRHTSLPFHPNGMRFFAFSEAGDILRERTYYSVGGFVVDETAVGEHRIKADETAVRYPFTTGAQLQELLVATVPRAALTGDFAIEDVERREEIDGPVAL